MFTCVNLSTGTTEELLDEDRSICEVRPFLSVLRLVEHKKDETENQLKIQIGLLIGKSKSCYGN